MICAKCRQELPDDSEFCQYCGTALIVEVFDPNLHEEKPPERSKKQPEKKKWEKNNRKIATPIFCKKCGGIIDADTKKCTSCGHQYFNSRAKIPVIITIVLLSIATLLSTTLYFFQWKENRELSEKNQALLGEIDISNDTIANLRLDSDEQQRTIEKLQQNSDTYQEIFSIGRINSLGYCSNHFCASEGVVFVKLSETGRKITLTANSDDGVLCTASPSTNPSALLTFDYQNFQESTTMTITPCHVGVTEFTLRSGTNNGFYKNAALGLGSFTVIVVVYE